MDKRRFIIITLLILALCTSVCAESGRVVLNWYNVNNKNHLQPRPDGEMSIIQNYNAVSADTAHGDGCADKVIYLTFDAGYENGNITRILDTLRDENVPAAFFVLENLITRDTVLVNRMFDEGHAVCNHTCRHGDMTKLDRDAFAAELAALERICRESTGRELARFYRPPEGRFCAENLGWADELGYKTVFWSFAYADWDNKAQPDPEAAKQKILAHTHNGEIILLHPTSATNAAILGDLIREWRAMGYRFGTLDEL